jgi:Putative zinc-binding metallo-peptidase
MKRGQTVSYKQLNSALYDVQEELYKVGLWYHDAPIAETEVVWCAWPQIDVPGASGFFIDGLWGISGALARLLGYEAGNIYIPKWILLHGPWQNRGSLRDLVRHEYGHALMWHFEEEGESKEFIKPFGGSYSSNSGSPMFADCYVSKYAMTNPAEDFAETFMHYLRNPSARLSGPKKLRQKFKYVGSLCEKCGG